MATSIERIKSGKAASEVEIKLKMLKALNGIGILWLTQANLINVWSCMKVWQNSQKLENRCDYSDIQERKSQATYELQRDITP